MPYPRPHNVLQVFGTNAHTAVEDIWTMTLRVGREDGPGAGAAGPAPDAVLTDVATDLTTWWNALATLFPNSVSMLGFKFNAVGVDGKYVSEGATAQRTFGATGLKGSGTTASLPPQCSCVVTFHTSTARGLASKGRWFLPPFLASTMTGGGIISAADANKVQAATATLLTNLGNWPGLDALSDPGQPVVASKVREGEIRTITGVSVGNVIDTQRRRRNAYKEVRSAIAPVT